MTVEELNDEINKLGGCSDGYCVITGPAKGMHTNGGCRCWMNNQKMQKLSRLVYSFRKEAGVFG